MEKIKLWWQKRTPRDRRAIVVLAIVLPVILFWYLITVPMQDRLQMAQRILQTRREEAMQVQKLLQEYSILKSQLDGVEFKASPRVVTKLEESFSQLSASETRPLLNRTNIVIFGQNQPAAQIRVSKALPKDFWKILSLIASSGVYLAEFDLSSSEPEHQFSASFKAWLPKQQ